MSVSRGRTFYAAHGVGEADDPGNPLDATNENSSGQELGGRTMARQAIGAYVFESRRDAGRQLARRLMGYRRENPIVLALPRGGVVVGYEVARALQAPLDVVVARKLGAPGHEELGIGAIAPGGVRVLDERAVQMLGISAEAIARVTAKETAEMDRRSARFGAGRSALDCAGRTVILVDDGLATGATARAATRFVLQQHPRQIVLAAPVCSPEAEAALRAEADHVVCLQSPAEFIAVGLWYRDFEQVSDEEVAGLLRQSQLRRDVAGSE